MEWRDIPGFEGVYQASTSGQIRRTWITHKNGRRELVNRIRRPYQRSSRKGKPPFYLAVSLSKDGRHVGSAVHRLVAAAFLGPMPVGMSVHHMDFNSLNNTSDNLEYVPLGHNTRLSAWRHPRGEAWHNSRLTEVAVRIIRRMAYNNTQSAIAKQFHVNPRTVRDVLIGRTWRHVE